MLFLIPVFNDPRGRHRFVSDPLTASGYHVETPSARTINDLIRVINLVRRAEEDDNIIIVGSGMKPLFIGIFSKIGRANIYLRLGGNTPFTVRQILKIAALEFKLKRFLRLLFNLLSYHIMAHLVDGVIVVNPELAIEIKDHFPTEIEIILAPQPGAPIIQTKRRKNRRKITVLSATNLEFPSKADGIIWQICELAKLVSNHPLSIEIRVAGGGAFASRVESYLSSITLPKGLTVNLLGFVADLDWEYQRADIFMYRSYHDATPNVLLEAKRWQLAVIVNDYPPFRWLIDDELTGKIYTSREDFQASLLRLMQDPILRENLANAASIDYERRFSTTSVGKMLGNGLSARDVD